MLLHLRASTKRSGLLDFIFEHFYRTRGTHRVRLGLHAYGSTAASVIIVTHCLFVVHVWCGFSAVVSWSVWGVKGTALFLRSWVQIEFCTAEQLSFPTHCQTTYRDAWGSDSSTAIHNVYLSEEEKEKLEWKMVRDVQLQYVKNAISCLNFKKKFVFCQY